MERELRVVCAKADLALHVVDYICAELVDAIVIRCGGLIREIQTVVIRNRPSAIINRAPNQDIIYIYYRPRSVILRQNVYIANVHYTRALYRRKEPKGG